MTRNCINSLVESEKETEMEIIVIESNKNYNNSEFIYPDFVKVIIPEEDFNFHKFLNIGIKESKGEFVALCNNDLIFYDNWFTKIYNVSQNNTQIKSFSPSGRINDFSFEKEYELGYKVRTHVLGWCLVMSRKLIEKIGYLDETFNFNYADNDYALTLKKFNIKHALVNSSKVEHLEREKVKENRVELNKEYNKLAKGVKLNYDKLPKYAFSKGNEYLLESAQGLNDFLKYHKKWGSPNCLYRKNKIADFFILYNLGFLNKIVLWRS
jgi:GT2 family glycosyltransferase